jgi:uncharacterized Zn finger protein (UPF0148 family)
MADYEVKKGVFGHKVLYNCPACGTPLTSSLEKSGTNDACPDCNRPHVIPGIAEKTNFERATATKQLQKLEEEGKRRAAAQVAAKSVPKPIPKSVANTAPPISHPTQIPIPPIGFRHPKFGDGILDGAFVVARISSVAVIILGVVGLLIIAVQFGSAYSDYRPEQPASLKVPNASEFKTYVSLTTDAPSESTSGDNATTSEPSSKTPDPLSVLFKKHKLLADRFLLTEIAKLARELRSGEYEDFLGNLDQFLASQKDRNKAAQWFCNEYESSVEARDREIESNKFHNEMRSGRMWSLTTVAGGLFGGLIGFMVLPLLIRIEANTRIGDAPPSQTA